MLSVVHLFVYSELANQLHFWTPSLAYDQIFKVEIFSVLTVRVNEFRYRTTDKEGKKYKKMRR